MSVYTPSALHHDALCEEELMPVFVAHMENARETRGHKVNAWLDKLEARIDAQDEDGDKPGTSPRMLNRALRMVELNLQLEEPFAPEGTEALIEFLAGC